MEFSYINIVVYEPRLETFVTIPLTCLDTEKDDKINFNFRKMSHPIEVPKSSFSSIKKSFSVCANFIITWVKSKEETDVICKKYQSSIDVESTTQGFGSVTSTECLTDFSDSVVSSCRLPLHYNIIKSCLLDLRRSKSISDEFEYPNDIEWQNISNENLKSIFNNANVMVVNNAFLWAAFTKRWDLLKGFLDLGAQLNYYEPNYGLSALHLAAYSGCTEGTEFLLSQEGSDCNVMHKCYTPLHCTALGDSPETAKILLENGANIHILTNDLHCRIESILHCAVRANALSCVQIFCDMGANINQLDSYSKTSIHLAAELDCAECLKILVKANGANVNLQTKEKQYTALHLAAEGQHADCIDVLLENSACPHITNNRIQTPLHLAAKAHSNECLKVLLKKGKANPNAQDVDQRTPLHVAVSKAYTGNCSDVIRTLIRYGADVNPRDKEHYIPLHLAALNELLECAETLIMYDADITAKCKSGTTALGMICQKIPTCVDAIRKKLDESISFTQQDSARKEFELQIDFTTILQHCHPREITYLKTLVNEGQKELLMHPLCTAFLYLKWKKIRKFYIYRSIFFSIFVSVLSSYVLTGLAKNCYNVSQNITDSILVNYRDLCVNNSLTGKIINEYPYLIELQWFILVSQCIGILTRKICSISGYSSIKQYMCNLENILDWGCIITVFLISFVYTGRTYVWQNHISAFGVLLGWVNLFYILGQFPVFGTYVAMYISVQYEFAKLLFVFSFLLIGFTVSFCVLFPDSQAFSNIFIGYITVLVMAIGEMNFDLITDKSESHFLLEGSTQIIYVIFVTCVTIILLNLLVGIAVHDIQGLRKSAKLTKLMKQAQLVSYIEKAIFSDYFHKKIWFELCNWTSLVSAKAYGVLIVKPLHQRENKLPKEILLAAYEVARKHKKKNRHSLQQQTYQNKKKMNKNIKYDNKISNELEELKNNINNVNREIIDIKNTLESNQQLMEQILQVLTNDSNK